MPDFTPQPQNITALWLVLNNNNNNSGIYNWLSRVQRRFQHYLGYIGP